MKLRSKAALGSLVLVVVVACGRTEDDNHGGAGGPAGGSAGSGAAASGGAGGPRGGSAGSGAAASGGKLGVGGSSLAGASGNGGSTTVGGAAGEGDAAGAGGSIVNDGIGPVPLGEGSWDTKLALTVTKSVPNASVRCVAAEFTLHFSPSGSNLKAVSGRDGLVLTGELARNLQIAPGYGVAEPLRVPTRGDCDLGSIEITELTLNAWDERADGTPASIIGLGAARGNYILGDVAFTVELTFTLQGVPDKTKPSLLAPSSPHPLDGVHVRATEPVALSSSVTLMDTGGSASQPLVGYTASNGAFGTFSTAQILPFGSSWKLSATGGDLAQLPFDIANLPPVVMLADPGLFAQDGFESTPLLNLIGAAKIASSVGTLPAIKGTKSLFVPSGASATLHLARPTGASSVRFTAQSLTNLSGTGFGGADVVAGVIGGSARVQPTQALPTTPSTTTNDSTWMYAGPTQDVVLPLTESGADIVIRFAPPACQGFCPPSRALWIDELRVE